MIPRHWLCDTGRRAAALPGHFGLMAETDKLRTSQVSRRLSVGAIASRSHTMSHARRPLCCYLSCAATCHLFHSGPWVMGSPRGRGLGSLPPCGVKRTEQTDPQILHGRRTHRLDIWGHSRRQGLSGQIGVKKLRTHMFSHRGTIACRWLLAEFSVVCTTGYMVLAPMEQVERLN